MADVDDDSKDSRLDEVTRSLTRLGDGDRSAADRLMLLIYKKLRALAGDYFRLERPDNTLEPTALVHEAYIRLVHLDRVRGKDRAHFFALAATAMRRILVDRARRRGALKRGGQWRRVTLSLAANHTERSPIDLLSLDEAIRKLSRLDARQARIVELRYFAGLTVEEVAEVLEVSKRTVEKEWRAVRAWLGCELGG